MKNKIIFDVGAYDGIDGLALAIKNPMYLQTWKISYCFLPTKTVAKVSSFPAL